MRWSYLDVRLAVVERLGRSVRNSVSTCVLIGVSVAGRSIFA